MHVNDNALQRFIGFSDDILGLYNASSGNRWTYWFNSDLTVYYNGFIKGTWSSGNGDYTSMSDRRLKKDITPLGSVLASVNKLKAFMFRYKDNSSIEPLTAGFMAQDVQPLFPEAVKEISNKDGTYNLGIQYQYMSVYAIKAIQEQQLIINDLVKRLEKLERK